MKHCSRIFSVLLISGVLVFVIGIIPYGVFAAGTCTCVTTDSIAGSSSQSVIPSIPDEAACFALNSPPGTIGSVTTCSFVDTTPSSDVPCYCTFDVNSRPTACLTTQGAGMTPLRNMPAADCVQAGVTNSYENPQTPATPSSPSTPLLNPLTGAATGILPATLYGNIIRILIGVSGILALLNIVLGGVKWMTSQGNEEKITEGRNALVWASLGLLVVLSSYIILNFVLGVFSNLG